MNEPGPIREYMTAMPHTVPRETPLLEVRQLMEEMKVHHMPVIDGEHLVGILSDRDVTRAEQLLHDRVGMATVGEVMTEVPFTCGPEAQVNAVAEQMLERGCGSAVIVERDHPTSVLGIFTVTDALRLIKGLG